METQSQYALVICCTQSCETPNNQHVSAKHLQITFTDVNISSESQAVNDFSIS